MIGAPFAWGGRGPVEYDCWGLVLAIRPELPDYSACDTADAAREMRRHVVKWERVSSPESGDVVLLGRGNRPHHAGIVVDGGILHTTRETGAVIQPRALLRQPYLYPLQRFYRWPV